MHKACLGKTYAQLGTFSRTSSKAECKFALKSPNGAQVIRIEQPALCLREHSACCGWLLLSLLALIFIPTSPVIADFGVREFQSKEQMQTFLQGLGFLCLGNKRGEYNLWETKSKPYVRALSYKLQNGSYRQTVNSAGPPVVSACSSCGSSASRQTFSRHYYTGWLIRPLLFPPRGTEASPTPGTSGIFEESVPSPHWFSLLVITAPALLYAFRLEGSLWISSVPSRNVDQRSTPK
jgi:hypothetical protein